MELISNEILTSDNPNISFIVGHNSTNEEYYALNKSQKTLIKLKIKIQLAI